MTSTLFAVLLAATAAAEEVITPPKGPPPTPVIASVTKDGEFEITQAVLVPEYQTRDRTVKIDGRSVKETYNVMVVKTEQRTRRLRPDGVKVYRTDGKEVAAKEVPGKLKQPMMVLLAADEHKVDPLYLRIIKADTLIIVAPAPTVTVEPPAPKPN